MTENVFDDSMEIFQNPANESLEKVEVIINEGGMPQRVQALSKRWVGKRYFLHYEIPNIYHENGSEIIGAKDRWLEIIGYIANDYDWLLQLPFYKFWSNIVFDPRIMDSIVSVLQDSPIFFTNDKFPNDKKMRKMLDTVHKKILIIFARIITNKASASEFIDREIHGKLIYDHFLITVPIIMDLCQLYGRENGKIVGRIIKSAMKLQPAYNKDLTEAVQFICSVLTTIEQNFSSTNISAREVIRLTHENGVTPEVPLNVIEDMIIHLLDISSNIEVFLSIYPSAMACFANDYFLLKLTTIYENSIVEICKKLQNLELNDKNTIRCCELQRLLLSTRMEFIKIFRIITFKDIAWILEQPTPAEFDGIKDHIDRFLHHLTNLEADSEFLIDYNTLYPIEEDLDLLNQITHDVDPIKQNFLIQLVYEITKSQLEFKKTKTSKTNELYAAGPSNLQVAARVAGSSNAISISSDTNRHQISTLVENVKDVMCDLGEGFIEKCLIHYNYDTARVINAILEESLPPELFKLDRTLPHIPPDPMAASAAVDEIVGIERLNIFDGDEFDIMTCDKIDKSRVHRGKRKDKYKNFNEMLNDKSFRRELADIYVKYDVITDEYEDEYDDTYESQDVGLRGVDDPLEVDGKHFTIPRVLRVNKKSETAIENDQEDAEESNDQENNARDNFIQDPAILRAVAEQRRLSKRGGGGSSRGGHVDVVGRAKGQGNEKNVLINRERKNINKSTRANHNRRTGAEWKRRQGMVPS